MLDSVASVGRHTSHVFFLWLLRCKPLREARASGDSQGHLRQLQLEPASRECRNISSLHHCCISASTLILHISLVKYQVFADKDGREG